MHQGAVVMSRKNDNILTRFDCYRDEESDEMKEDKQKLQARIETMGIRYKSLHWDCDGACYLNLSGTNITDLSPLKTLPVTHLCLQGCFGITDFSPLK
jgi:hypothetical protein